MSSSDVHKDHSSCSGCSLCLLACPVWHQTRDIRLTPHGRAKALQNGATAGDIAASVSQCTLCGTCEPACPENIPLVDQILALRRESPLQASLPAASGGNTEAAEGVSLLLPGRHLSADRVARISALLACTVAGDDGSDISLALETGNPLPEGRLRAFLDRLRGARRLVVADGLMLRKLREWLPDVRVTSLGAALSAHAAIRSRLKGTDVYVIEPRAFNGQQEALIGHYDELRVSTGCMTNLDLQRLAIPTAASAAQHALGLRVIDAREQARWILEGHAFERVVVEDAADCAVFAAVTDRPVVHVADL